jgi:hypothetical protein
LALTSFAVSPDVVDEQPHLFDLPDLRLDDLVRQLADAQNMITVEVRIIAANRPQPMPVFCFCCSMMAPLAGARSGTGEAR